MYFGPLCVGAHGNAPSVQHTIRKRRDSERVALKGKELFYDADRKSEHA